MLCHHQCDTIMHQAIRYHLDKSVLTRHYEETLSKAFTVNKVHLHQIQLRDSDQLKDGVPPQRTMSEGLSCMPFCFMI